MCSQPPYIDKVGNWFTSKPCQHDDRKIELKCEFSGEKKKKKHTSDDSQGKFLFDR